MVIDLIKCRLEEVPNMWLCCSTKLNKNYHYQTTLNQSQDFFNITNQLHQRRVQPWGICPWWINSRGSYVSSKYAPDAIQNSMFLLQMKNVLIGGKCLNYFLFSCNKIFCLDSCLIEPLMKMFQLPPKSGICPDGTFLHSS